MLQRKLEPGKVHTKAQIRIASLQSIDKDLDMGSGLALSDYQALADQYREAVNGYNVALGHALDLRDGCKELKAKLADLSERMLAAVAGKYGRRSKEYELAGGTRRTGHRKSARQAKKGNAK